jgi:hypothetical protein
MSIIYTDDDIIYVASGTKCPFCCTEIRASDIVVDRKCGSVDNCSGCHKDTIRIECMAATTFNPVLS